MNERSKRATGSWKLKETVPYTSIDGGAFTATGRYCTGGSSSASPLFFFFFLGSSFATGFCFDTRFSVSVRGSRRSSVSVRSEEHTSELQSRQYLVCRLLLEKK